MKKGLPMTENSSVPLTILRLKQVKARTGLSRSAIYDKLSTKSPRHDPTFPIQVRLGSDAVGWVESEIEFWLASRPRTRLI
jgi:prophage regulatory protein